MLRFIVGRVVGLAPVLCAAIVATFIATRLLPGDPVAVMLSDHSADVQMAARLRAEYGLDKPLPEQFVRYIGDILTGDFGLSFRYVHMPVWQVLKDSLLISPLLALAALALALPVGALAGVQAAAHRNRFQDTAIIVVLVAGLSLPNFAIATFLVYLISVKLNLLPVAGWGTFRQAILPVVILAIPSAAYIARLTRTFMLEVMQQDFVRTARAKGLTNRLVIYRHAFRNTLVPLITSAGIIFGGLLSNTVVVETIFNIPGLGRLAIDSIFARDYPVAMAVVMLFVVFFALINLIVDTLYALVDPRVRDGAPA
ncbi:MAG: peptide ABC transporter permease [Rhizobiales bacterium 65-9]|nr:ABC transporter permease [Hyphomicrobiales bacterium]OJY35319.1 MAG: peptide ABC transporter permease [Rhizobiales bacterium 65-9]